MQKMQNITIGLYEDIFNDIKDRAKKKGFTATKYIRDLIDLGLKIEDMAKEKPSNSKDKLTEHSLLVMQEMLYLTRFIAIHGTKMDEEETKAKLKEFKIRAQSFVEGLSN